MKLTFLSDKGYAIFKDKAGQSWRFVVHTNEWFSEEADDPDLVSPPGEVGLSPKETHFLNKENAMVQLNILFLKREASATLNLTDSNRSVYEEILRLLNQAEMEKDFNKKAQLCKDAYGIYNERA